MREKTDQKNSDTDTFYTVLVVRGRCQISLSNFTSKIKWIQAN